MCSPLNRWEAATPILWDTCLRPTGDKLQITN